MIRLPSPTYSPDLDWWLHDSGAAFGETSALGPSLQRMELYRDRKTPRRAAWKPDRKPRRPEDRDRDLAQIMPGEANSIDPNDYFVEGNPIERSPRARASDMRRCKPEPVYTAIPKSLGEASLGVFEPDIRNVDRARRVARAWFKLSTAQRQRLWLAYLADIDWGTELEHRAFRKGLANEDLIELLAGQFRDRGPRPSELMTLMDQLLPLIREAHDAA